MHLRQELEVGKFFIVIERDYPEQHSVCEIGFYFNEGSVRPRSHYVKSFKLDWEDFD